MKLAIKNGLVIGIHEDFQSIASLYPEATIKKIINGVYVELGQPDPTIAHPEYEITMQLFLHTAEKVRIINEGLNPSEFVCSPADFQTLEPDYPALPPGAVGRYWTPDLSYAMDSQGGHFVEEFDGSVYTALVDQYAADLPCIYADVQVSADRLCLNADPPDTITFQAWIKDDQANILPVTESWIIRLRDADNEEVDAFEVQFTDGATPQMNYSCPPAANLGRIHVDENDFDSVAVPGVGTFQVKLLNPVEFTIYRQL